MEKIEVGEREEVMRIGGLDRIQIDAMYIDSVKIPDGPRPRVMSSTQVGTTKRRFRQREKMSRVSQDGMNGLTNESTDGMILSHGEHQIQHRSPNRFRLRAVCLC